jgi:hypothetical protein
MDHNPERFQIAGRGRSVGSLPLAHEVSEARRFSIQMACSWCACLLGHQGLSGPEAARQFDGRAS